jgi:hypothetical protein|tara:strand:+ start:420 stop:1007 length:588 start_codon:yes stop_codon:yes gene_type:complete
MYLIATVPQDITKSLDEIIQKKHEARANKDLAGNIQNEFFINDGKGIIWPMLDVLIKQYFEKYPEYLGRISGMQNKKEFVLGLHNMWANYQSKHEFNPVHIHDGLFSFVIWHKVPYLMKDEKARFPHMKDSEIRAAHFVFMMSDQLGRIQSHCIPVDKEWEGKMALFPASLNHQVYPFYTSDEYRISISGNIGFQ